MQLGDTTTKRRRKRFDRFKIIFPILLAGWIPSILTLIVSYTILRDRQTLIQLLGHVVGHDLSRSSAIINYYQTLPEVAKILIGPNPVPAAQQWLDSHGIEPVARGRFDEFLKQNPAPAGKQPSSAEKEALFKQFQAWQAEQQNNARAQVPQVRPAQGPR